MASFSKTPGFLAGGGEMGERIRNFDWGKTPLGPPENWEQSLKTCVRIMLTSSQPIWIGWGKDLIKLYNDPYKAIVGGKHPQALGQPASVVWKDIWKDISPLLKKVMDEDEGTYVESQLLIMERNHYPEETYYTFSYTPIPGDKGGTGGMICANTDDTGRIVNERALKTLRDLGKISYRENNTAEIYTKAVKVLAENDKDFPFAVVYEIDNDLSEAKLVAWAGFEREVHFPDIIDIQNPNSTTQNLCRAVTANEIVLSQNADRDHDVPKGFWDIAPNEFLYIPICLSKNANPNAVLLVGLNPFRKYDSIYQQFISLITDQLTLGLNNIQALESERKRAEALAEIDRAKTVFFNNISHEFRTPLTLMLGPLEEMLQQPKADLNEKNWINLETTHRNAMRLLKLVNTLLDFSRIESGRQKAHFSLTDLSKYTANLASSFRSIIEKAGLKLIVNTDTNNQEVYVDKQMWEKIVFNLLSNAFKYTLKGTIEVHLFSSGTEVILEVADTGVGIPASELPHMFERFHRVEGIVGRTYEGTGIGLSMIKELVTLHGGSISVRSIVGSGSTFSVHIPVGHEHLPPAQILSDTNHMDDAISAAFINEAFTLVEDAGQFSNNHSSLPKSANREETILIVDDNADMRQYLQSLISEKYHVVTATNGTDALRKITEAQPTLILSDIMMPIMDGFSLLKEVKQNPKTFHIPLILLSARAGEESRIEGYEVGADDYLVKPFAAKELMARIKSQLRVVAARKKVEQQLRNLFLQAPVAISILRGPKYVLEVTNEKMLELWGKEGEDLLNKPLFEAVPDARGQGFEELLDSVYQSGERLSVPEASIVMKRHGKMEKIYFSYVYEPIYDEEKHVTGIMIVANDITSSVIARQKIEESERRFRRIADKAPVMIWMTGDDGHVTFFNQAWLGYTGYAQEEDASKNWATDVHPDDIKACMDVYLNAFKSREEFYTEYRLKRHDGQYRWISSKGVVRVSPNGIFEGFIGACMDIHEQKAFASELERQVKERTEQLVEINSELAQKNKDLQSFAYVSSHDLQEPLRKIQTLSSYVREMENDNLSEKGKNYFQRIQEASAKMQRLINDLLTYSRLTSAEHIYESTDLVQLIADLKEDMREVITEKRAIVDVESANYIRVIPFQFRQLLNNLIGNSLKFSKRGIAPQIQVKSEEITGSPSREYLLPGKKYWLISVSDNGIGFEAEYKHKIFEVFQRLHTKSEYPGTGIGLAIVKRIVENHKGFITAESELNQGARFDIYIPQ